MSEVREQYSVEIKRGLVLRRTLAIFLSATLRQPGMLAAMLVPAALLVVCIAGALVAPGEAIRVWLFIAAATSLGTLVGPPFWAYGGASGQALRKAHLGEVWQSRFSDEGIAIRSPRGVKVYKFADFTRLSNRFGIVMLAPRDGEIPAVIPSELFPKPRRTTAEARIAEQSKL